MVILKTLIGGCVENPDKKISLLPSWQQERIEILVDWNHTAADYPTDLTIHAAFEQRAAKTLRAVAFLHRTKPDIPGTK
jgi:non-ribosomal peptide synthetase component F